MIELTLEYDWGPAAGGDEFEGQTLPEIIDQIDAAWTKAGPEMWESIRGCGPDKIWHDGRPGTREEVAALVEVIFDLLTTKHSPETAATWRRHESPRWNHFANGDSLETVLERVGLGKYLTSTLGLYRPGYAEMKELELVFREEVTREIDNEIMRIILNGKQS